MSSTPLPTEAQDRAAVLNLAGKVEESVVDGPGIRTVIFAQGCPRRCEGCHNPQSHPFHTGTDCTAEQLLRGIEADPLVRGVTFSGGEPFSQAAAFAALGRCLKRKGYEVAAYTGFVLEELLTGTPEQRALLQTLDILVDGPFVLAQRNLDLRFRGSDNQRVLDVPASLAADAAVWTAQERWTGPRRGF